MIVDASIHKDTPSSHPKMVSSLEKLQSPQLRTLMHKPILVLWEWIVILVGYSWWLVSCLAIDTFHDDVSGRCHKAHLSSDGGSWSHSTAPTPSPQSAGPSEIDPLLIRFTISPAISLPATPGSHPTLIFTNLAVNHYSINSSLARQFSKSCAVFTDLATNSTNHSLSII